MTEKDKLPGVQDPVLHIAPGFLLKDGLTCIASDSHTKTVLAVQVGAFEPYVTWKYDWDPDEQRYIFWAGHYFQRIWNAAKDFKERA